MQAMQGTGISAGIAIGRALHIRTKNVQIPETKNCDAAAEKKRFLEAVDVAISEADELARENPGQREILEANALILKDPETHARVFRFIDNGANVLKAVDEGLGELILLFKNMENEYIAQRAEDIAEIRRRLLEILDGDKKTDLSDLPPDSIVVAESMGAAEFTSIQRKRIAGLLLGQGGTASHIAILARAAGIPSIFNAGNAIETIEQGTTIALDGASGEYWICPDQAIVDTLNVRDATQKKIDKANLQGARAQAHTSDGTKIAIYANIGTPAEAEKAVQLGADGIGLFRSEFLFLERKTLPTENEQYESYDEACRGMGGRPVIIRTMDIGGDKNVPALKMPKEENPFLGIRGARLSISRPELFHAQLGALLRAGASGDVRIMFPMIATVAEVRKCKKFVQKAQEDLEKRGLQYNHHPKIGIMIEVPAAALCAQSLAEECDFFSIGTNDLTQYTMAADRVNEALNDLYSPYQPAVLSLIAQTVKSAEKAHIPCDMCGEAAADPALLPVWLGIGLRELSVRANRIPSLKAQVKSIDLAKARGLADRVLCARSVEEVRILSEKQSVTLQ